jgi:hypothetical protein
MFDQQATRILPVACFHKFQQVMDLCCVARLHEASSVTVMVRVPTDILPRTLAIFPPGSTRWCERTADQGPDFLEIRGPG